jgi:outer membrane protein insertion porin family
MRLQAAEAATTSASSTVIRTALPVAPPVHRVLELEQIVVTGNSHISDSEILETLGLAPHDTVNVSILEDARLRLLKDFPLLKSVDLSTSPGSRRGLIILDIAVVERNPVVFETGYGLHDTYGWFLTLLGIRIDPAAAYGTEYRLGLRLGFHIAGLDGEFEQHPKPGRIGLGGNFHLYSQDQIFFAGESAPGIWDATDATRYSRQFRQKIKRSGAELYLFSKLADSTKFSFGYHVEGVRPESSFVESESGQKYQFADFPSSLQTGIKNSTITGLVFRVVRDTRDLLAYPRAGSFGLVQVQTNSTILGGDETFVKADGDLRKHIGLGGWSVLSSRLSAGIVSKRTPYYERFFLGGMYSIRGFRGLSLSPPRGSDGFMIGSEEFRFPLIASRANVPPKLTGLVFVDAGIGWVRGEAFKASDIEAAAGYGVRLRLPWIGTLGIDAGVPFTDGRTGDQFYIHGCLGFSF